MSAARGARRISPRCSSCRRRASASINRVKALWSGRRGPPILPARLRRAAACSRKRPVYSTSTTPVFRLAPYVVLVTARRRPACVVPAPRQPRRRSLPVRLRRRSRTSGGSGASRSCSARSTPAARSRAWARAARRRSRAPRAGVLPRRRRRCASLTGAALVRVGPRAAPDRRRRTRWSGSRASSRCFIVVQVESARMPVDDPTTHLELTMVHEVMILDHSGPELAALQAGAAIKLSVGLSLIATLLNPLVGRASRASSRRVQPRASRSLLAVGDRHGRVADRAPQAARGPAVHRRRARRRRRRAARDDLPGGRCRVTGCSSRSSIVAARPAVRRRRGARACSGSRCQGALMALRSRYRTSPTLDPLERVAHARRPRGRARARSRRSRSTRCCARAERAAAQRRHPAEPPLVDAGARARPRRVPLRGRARARPRATSRSLVAVVAAGAPARAARARDRSAGTFSQIVGALRIENAIALFELGSAVRARIARRSASGRPRSCSCRSASAAGTSRRLARERRRRSAPSRPRYELVYSRCAGARRARRRCASPRARAASDSSASSQSRRAARRRRRVHGAGTDAVRSAAT